MLRIVTKKRLVIAQMDYDSLRRHADELESILRSANESIAAKAKAIQERIDAHRHASDTADNLAKKLVDLDARFQHFRIQMLEHCSEPSIMAMQIRDAEASARIITGSV